MSDNKKKNVPGPVADINVTPMVDVMLVMLIIFMVITPMLSKGITVDLVNTRNAVDMADADKEDAILVSITKDGKVYLGSDMYPELPKLGEKVKDMLTNRLDKTVYLKNDSRTRYERVVEVVDGLRAYGVDTLGLITDKIKDNSAPAPASGD